MIVDSFHDIMIFALSLMCGIADGIIFDFFRAMRRVFSHGKKMVAVQDMIFCFMVFVLFSYIKPFFSEIFELHSILPHIFPKINNFV